MEQVKQVRQSIQALRLNPFNQVNWSNDEFEEVKEAVEDACLNPFNQVNWSNIDGGKAPEYKTAGS